MQTYILAVEAAFAAAFGWAASVTQWHLHHLILFLAVISVGAASAETGRRIAMPHGIIARDLFSLWCLPAAIALPPVYAMLTPIPAVAHIHFRGPKGTGYRRVFSAAVMGLAFGTSSVLFHLAPPGTAGPRPGDGTHAIVWVLLVAACGVIRWAVNHGGIVMAIKLSEPGAGLRNLVVDPDSVSIDVLELALGILMTLAVAINPVLIVLAVPTVTALQRGVGYSQLLSQARVDAKTGLLNAVTWQREALAELARAARARTPSAVMMVDIDHFKTVNDTFGHQAGDMVLANVAAAMSPLLREYDLVGRFGGEEFAVFLPDTTAAEARKAAERLRKNLAEVATPVGSGAKAAEVRVTVSIGVATDETSHFDLTELIAAADASLYHVKENGRNGVRISAERPAVTTTVRDTSYGDKLVAIEPGGSEFIELSERHGRPPWLFLTWSTPNLEFATVFVGVLGVALFGLNFWQAVLAIALGNAAGSVAQGLLSARGPAHGVPQMVLSRLGFGYWGNVLPAGLNALTAGIGWFAVNSVSGAFALSTLTHWSKPACLLLIVVVQVVIAFFGHNLVLAFERYAFPPLAVIFLLTTVVILAKSHPGMAVAVGSSGKIGGFLLAAGAAFGYAAGWNPYAADYTRYLPPDTSRRAVALWSGLGLFVSCALLEIVGAASATLGGNALGNPTGSFTGHLPAVLADATLVAIALGAVGANVLNIYSGALSFTALGIRLPLRLRRAIVALTLGAIGLLLALAGLRDAGANYENFLLVIAYWIAPWLAVFFCDQLLRRGPVGSLLYDRGHTNWAGLVAMAAGMGASIWLFSNQTAYVGIVPAHLPWVGDLTFEAGFLLTAAVYLGWHAARWVLREDRRRVSRPSQAPSSPRQGAGPGEADQLLAGAGQGSHDDTAVTRPG